LLLALVAVIAVSALTVMGGGIGNVLAAVGSGFGPAGSPAASAPATASPKPTKTPNPTATPKPTKTPKP
jgi:hypothetical protein